MNTENSTLNFFEKIKAFAMALIGSMFFSYGLTVFQPQAEYKIPRILIPIFEIFGNIGLALGLLILGVALIYFAYRKFTKFGGKSSTILIMILGLLVSAFIIFKFFDKKQPEVKPTVESITEKIENSNSKVVRPVMKDTEANALMDKREDLLQKMTEANKNNDNAALTKLESQFWQTNKDYAQISMKIQNDEKYHEFIQYNDQIVSEVKNLKK